MVKIDVINIYLESVSLENFVVTVHKSGVADVYKAIKINRPKTGPKIGAICSKIIKLGICELTIAGALASKEKPIVIFNITKMIEEITLEIVMDFKLLFLLS